jgi:peptidase E
MKRRAFVVSSALGSMSVWGKRLAALEPKGESMSAESVGSTGRAGTRKVLIAGGNFNTTFVRYMATLTGKKRPKLLFLPTASADSAAGTIAWFKSCAPLDVEASVQDSFIESLSQTRSWEDVLLSVDGIVASGGNTLNQQAIWKAQGIDVILRKAWDQGIVLGGASAGSLCWFEEGTTDSRPKELSTVYCLGFIKGSHCPHYDKEVGRRPLYHKLIGSGQMKPGYACDNDAGIYFEDNEVKRVVSGRAGAKVYYVSRSGNEAVEKVMEPEMIS